jgi:hypothetical protein
MDKKLTKSKFPEFSTTKVLQLARIVIDNDIINYYLKNFDAHKVPLRLQSSKQLWHCEQKCWHFSFLKALDRPSLATKYHMDLCDKGVVEAFIISRAQS